MKNIIEFKTSEVKGLFVKVPDNTGGHSFDNYRQHISADQQNKINVSDWFSEKLPDGKWKIVGYSHKLLNEQIKTLGLDYDAYLKVLHEHNIYVNLSEYSGSYLVLIESLNH